MPAFRCITCRPPVSQIWGPLQKRGMPAYLDLMAMPAQLLLRQKKLVVKPTGIDAVSRSIARSTSGAAVTCSQKGSGPCRRRLLCEKDPVNSVKLAAFFKRHVEQSARVHGCAFQEAWGRLDPRLAAQLQNDMNR